MFSPYIEIVRQEKEECFKKISCEFIASILPRFQRSKKKCVLRKISPEFIDYNAIFSRTMGGGGECFEKISPEFIAYNAMF